MSTTVEPGRDLDLLHHSPLETGTPAEPTSSAGADLELQHWRVHRDDGRILWAILDKQGASANTLDRAVLEELAKLVAKAAESRARGLVIRSAKRAGFIAGADIGMFREIDDAAKAEELLREAHEAVNALADLSIPTVAVVHGHCLGGGLEVALACDFRIARSDSSLGFPEVQLGLHPGLGGTARLPEVIRPDEALRMMLTGKPVPAQKARSLGLVDAVVEERHVARAVSAAVDGDLESRAGGASVRAMSLGPARRVVVHQARNKTEERARPEHYPAPFRLLDLYRDHGGDVDEMLKHEPASFAELLLTDTSRNLVRVFFLREALKSASKASSGIDHVHVIGAGTMGGDIAAWCAHQGLTATVEDQSAELIGPTMSRAADLFEYKHRDRRERQAVADRLIPDPRGDGRRRADLIIEAVPENLELKQKIFSELEGQVRDDAILATNTSGILLADIGEALERPERLVGIHFFNPVSRMQLVEVVRHDAVSDEIHARAMALVTEIDRLPVAVRSSPGFLVNRILTPYLVEALVLLDEGVEPELVDAAAESFGMPMGPVELADRVGLDVALDVADGLHANLDAALPEIPDWLRQKVEDGDLGRKTGRGLYEYNNGDPEKEDVDVEPDDELVDRLILPMVNTAVTCLGEGIVEESDQLDAAIIFGTGFAPFRGGPIHYAESRGPAKVRERLARLTKRHGPRFEISEHWGEVFEDTEEDR